MVGPTTALLYSGGRDSHVLLHICRDFLDDMVVLWVDTQAHYESTYTHMHQVQERIPHFYIVGSNQPQDIKNNGYPTDILPIKYDSFGQRLAVNNPIKLQSTFACCAKNMWIPLDLAMKDLGVTRCLMGNREDESLTDKRWDREENGIDFWYPLRKWTLAMVQDYVKKHSIALPGYYASEEKSRDCWNCTGYLWERRQAIKNLPPEQKAEVQLRLGKIYRVLQDELDPIRGLLWV